MELPVWFSTLTAVTYTFTPIGFIVFYVLILWIMITRDEFKRKSCYKMMFHLGLCDLAGLVANVLAGTFALTALPFPNNILPIKLLSTSLVAAPWYSYYYFMTLIALNRAAVVCRWKHVEFWFSPTATNLWVGIGWLSHVALWLTCATDTHCIGYSAYFPSWFYQVENASISTFGFVWHKVTIGLSCGCYVALFAYVRVQHNDQTVSQARAQQQSREIRIAIQASFITIFAFFGSWDIPMLLFADQLPLALFMGNCFWIINSSNNVVIYLVFNRQIRTEVRSTIRFGGSSQVGPTGTVHPTAKDALQLSRIQTTNQA